MNIMTSRSLKTLALGAALAALPTLSARAAGFGDLYTAGHADVAVTYDPSTGLEFFYELSRTAVVNGSPIGGSGREADPSTISVVVPESVKVVGNSNLPAPFAGNDLYLLSQTSVGAASRPFLGFGAEEVDGGIFVGDVVKFALTSLAGPSGGEFVLYSNANPSAPDAFTANGLPGSAANFVNVYTGGHDHYNLGFTKAGIYDLTLTASGTLVGGGDASTSAVFRFVVGDQAAAVPEPSSLAMAGLAVGCGALFAKRRRRS